MAEKEYGENNKKTSVVAVAMSGGVDSSVAAALLKQRGFKVFGITMKTFCTTDFFGTDNTDFKKICCGQEGVMSAREVCGILNIPHYTVDVSKEFTEKVINDFISEYKAGRTPNPCVRCNQFIKFDLLLKLSTDFLGTDYTDILLATGHYARIEREIPNSKFQIPIFHLLRGKDKNKDQSYFLCRLTQKQLAKILFPLGDLTKDKVRKLAEKFKLPVAQKPESQEICFINTNVYEFLSSRINANMGEIADSGGKVIGKHRGIAFYTIGQRAGVGGKGPYYVAKIDKKRNRIVVTNNPKDPLILKKEIVVSNVHWILPNPPIPPLSPVGRQGGLGGVEIQIRYKSKPVLGKIFKLGKDRVKVKFSKPVFAPAPGQSAVFYKGDECLGGGIIKI